MSKQSTSSADLGEALVCDLLEPSTLDAVKSFQLDAAAVTRFTQKARHYGIATILMALARQEESNPQFRTVRAEFERRIFPATPEEGEPLLHAIKSAMKDLNALFFPATQPKELSWAQNWLLEIGVNENNPATLTLLAVYWMNYYASVSKALQSFTLA